MGALVEILGRRRFRLARSYAIAVDGVVYDVWAELDSDGGSNPRASWSLMGHPLSFPDEFFLHDQMCRRPQDGRTLAEVHWIFYRALLARVAIDFAVRPERDGEGCRASLRYQWRRFAHRWNHSWRLLHAAVTYAAVMIGKRSWTVPEES